MEKELIDRLKASLPHGSLKVVAEKLNHTRSHVSMVLRGKTKNPEILAELIRIAKEYSDLKAKIRELS